MAGGACWRRLERLERDGIILGRRVEIDQSLMEDDKDMLEDLVAAAVNDAAHRIAEKTQESMSGLTAGLPLPPGMKLPF